MKYTLLAIALLFTLVSFAQSASVKPVFERTGDLVKATFYYDNRQVAQTGFYKDTRPHGEWESYNPQGAKTAIALYDEGKKVGKWFFWNGEKLVEVDYRNNSIVRVTNWSYDASVVVN